MWLWYARWIELADAGVRETRLEDLSRLFLCKNNGSPCHDGGCGTGKEGADMDIQRGRNDRIW